MNRNIAGTDLSPSAVHAIVEIGLAGFLSAHELRLLLILEKSSISRLVHALSEKGLITETNSKEDGRVKLIELTSLGRQKLKAINAYAENRISTSLSRLNANDCSAVLRGISLYSEALTKSRLSEN